MNKHLRRCKLEVGFILACFLTWFPLASGQSQEIPVQDDYAQPVPRLIRFTGVLRDAARKPRTGIAGVLFSIYSDATGGAPLWQEGQNVRLDSQGRYSILLGSSTKEGIPVALFASGEPRWMGVRAMFPDEEEQPRILLVSVPYAMRAADADTLGGWPASAFVKAVKRDFDIPPSSATPGAMVRAGAAGTTFSSGSGRKEAARDPSPIPAAGLNNNVICYANDYPGGDIFAQFNAAIAACGHGEIRIRQGTYNSVTTTARLINPADSMVCEGAVTINFIGSGDAVYWLMTPFTNERAGKIEGCKIVGTFSGTSGIHMGDIVGWTLDRIVVSGFTRVGASGIWWDNHNGWTERGSVTPTVATNSNNIGWRMTNSGGPVTESFCYNRVLGLAMTVSQNQTGISTESGKFCHGTMIATINGTGTNKTLVSLSGHGLWEDSFYQITTEDDGAGGVRLSIGPGATLTGMGIFDHFNTATPMRDSILGGFALYLSHPIPWGVWFVDKEANLEIQAAGAATAGNNFSAPFIQQKGSYWNGSTTAVDSLILRNVLGTGTNPSSFYTISHVGSPGPFGLFLDDGVGHGFRLSSTDSACSNGPCIRHDSADDLILDTSGTGQLYLNWDNNRPIQTGAGPFILQGHLGQKNVNGDLAGTITLATAESASHSFRRSFILPPVCTVTPASDPLEQITWWVTSTPTSVTAHVRRNGQQSITFNYHCIGNPN